MLSTSSIRGSAISTVAILFVLLFGLTNARPQQQEYLPPVRSTLELKGNQQPQQTFFVPQQAQQQLTPSASSSQQQFVANQQAPIQIQVPIPNDSVQEKKIYVQLPPQQYVQQQPHQYRYPPRKHYKIILVRSPPQPTPPPVPVLPEIEEQTLVYVLVKKPDTPSAAEIEQLQQQQLQQQQQSFKLNKPEVYFIKYKANEQRAVDVPPESIEKSIEHQLGNNLVGAGSVASVSSSAPYTYEAVNRRREAKNLNLVELQDMDDIAEVVMENEKKH